MSDKDTYIFWGDFVTEQELLKKYDIPAEIIDKYRKLYKCSSFDDADVQKMSIIMTLYEVGFDDKETEKYIKLYLSSYDTTKERLEMLTTKRKGVLSDIHSRQKQIDCIDYMRYKISNENIKG